MIGEVAGDRDGQRPDRGGLIDNHQHRAVLGQSGQHGAQRGLVVRQCLVVQPLAAGVDRAGMVLGLTDIQPAEHGELGRVPVRIGQPPLPSRRGRPAWSTRAGSHACEQTTRVRSLSAVVGALRPRRQHPPPDHRRQGRSVIPRPAACKPLLGLIKKVTGGVRRGSPTGTATASRLGLPVVSAAAAGGDLRWPRRFGVRSRVVRVGACWRFAIVRHLRRGPRSR